MEYHKINKVRKYYVEHDSLDPLPTSERVNKIEKIKEKIWINFHEYLKAVHIKHKEAKEALKIKEIRQQLEAGVWNLNDINHK